MKKIRKIAIKRINVLFRRAFEIYDKNENLARRYIRMAWIIKNKIRIRLPKKFRNKFCKKCFTPWIIGKSLSVRLRNKKIVYKCLKCGFVKRFPYKNK